MRLGGNSRKIEGTPGKLHAKFVDELGSKNGSECSGDGLVAIKIVLERGGKIKTIVQRRLVQKTAVVDKIADKQLFVGIEAVIHANKAIVGIVGAKNAAEIRLGRQTVDGFYFVDGMDVLQHGGIVERRFAAALRFVISKNKSFVPGDGTADGRAELILAEDVGAGGLQ